MPPQKLSKETLEKIEEDNTIVLPTISQKAVKRVMTKPKTEAQMEAMRKALAKRKELLAIKKEEQAKQQEEQAKQKQDEVAKRKEEEEALIKAGTHTRYKVLPKGERGRPRTRPEGTDKYGRPIPEDEEIHEPKEKESSTYCEVSTPAKQKPKKERKPRRRYVSDTETDDTTEVETETETDTDYDSDYKQKKRVVRREVKKNIKALKKIDEVIEASPFSMGTNPWAAYLERKWK
jgi:hypothetical protein